MSQQLPPLATAALAQFRDIAQRRELWPGFRPEAIPLVLHGPDRAYLINHPHPPDGFVALEGSLSLPTHAGPATPAMAANTAQVVGGVLCAMAALPGEGANPERFARLLLHECFHVFQKQGMPAVALPDFALMGRYPENDPVNNAMAVVENRLLLAALAGERAAIPQFTAVRRRRQSRLGPELADYEAGQEYNEGTPTYIEVQAGRPMDEVAAMLNQCNLGGRWAAYRRFYATGAIMALLLDRYQPGWQRRFAKGSLTLQKLLMESEGPLPAAEPVLAEVGYAELLAGEQEREAERQRQIADLIAGLESGPGYRIEIDARRTPFFSWDPNECLVVEPGVRLHTRWFALQGDGIKVEVTGVALEDQTRGVVVTRVRSKPVVTGEKPFRVKGEGLKGQAPRGSLEPMADGYRLRLEGE